MKTSHLFGLSIVSESKSKLLELLKSNSDIDNQLKIIFTPNPEQIVQAQQDPQFFINLFQADYLLPDGIGLVWASRWLSFFGKSLPIAERIAGVELAQDLLNWSYKGNKKVLVIGGREYDKSPIYKKYQGKSLVWAEGFKNAAQPLLCEQKEIADLLKSQKPQVVFVALGAPHQENWIIEHRSLLEKSGVQLAMAVGGSFDYIFGSIERAPGLVRAMGLEWLFRLFKQPWRWKRQLRLIKFACLTVFSTFREGK